ncbi:helix-turn-helix domain-containing protein [Zhouia spongiae]|uniref:Helix-turn-helix domain-containing protein n=1 Tax=Zhouia spongiae TaxID=2202721 RepID=A0ABY3YL00_9FLAO|nr:helix-turn-helix domain-containing protein [Zhouia spongiae]UNY98351.1 helix-turn-helix domain-containing protein [Zhouia spongiae]
MRYKNEKILSIIGKRIRDQRKIKELEIEDVAEMTGFTYNTISNIENGSETYFSYFVEVCLAIDIHPKEMLDFDIQVKPRRKLSPQRREKSRLTYRIKGYIENGYFQTLRTTKDVVIKLKEEYDFDAASKDVSSILRRHLKAVKKGNRNFYKEK